MRVPLRSFTFDIPVRKKSGDSGGSTTTTSTTTMNLNNNSGKNKVYNTPPPTSNVTSTNKVYGSSAMNQQGNGTATIVIEKEKKRLPSPGRLFSKASQLRLRVTARASSLDLLSSSSSPRSTPPPQQQQHLFASSASASVTALSTPLSLTAPKKMADLLGGSFSSSGMGDDIDLDRAASAFPDIGVDGSGDFDLPTPGATTTAQASTISFDDFDEPLQQKVTDVKVTGDDEIERFEDQFPDIGGGPTEIETPVVTQNPTFGAPSPFPAPRPQPSAFTSTPILQQPLPDEEEPEVIKEWREKQAAEIKARDEASQARRQETIAKAERSIDQFYEDYNAKKERNIKENKLQEQEYLSSFTDSLSAGTTWSRICDYIELHNSQSKTLARTGAGTTDLTRFKEVLLRLKREGESAPGAAGY